MHVPSSAECALRFNAWALPPLPGPDATDGGFVRLMTAGFQRSFAILLDFSSMVSTYGPLLMDLLHAPPKISPKMVGIPISGGFKQTTAEGGWTANKQCTTLDLELHQEAARAPRWLLLVRLRMRFACLLAWMSTHL